MKRGRPVADRDEVQIINPPNLIAQKVTKGGPDAVTAADLAGADERVARNFGNQYVEWLAEDILSLHFPSDLQTWHEYTKSHHFSKSCFLQSLDTSDFDALAAF